jgi:DNA-directed RNA polymerase sigma subunit (sigma70/sigma32)
MYKSPDEEGQPEPQGPCTQAEVAEYLGISQQAVAQIERRALSRIRNRIENDHDLRQSLLEAMWSI